MKIAFESKGNFDKLSSWLDSVSKRDPSKVLNEIANSGTKSLTSNTPRDTGATALGWKAEVTTKGNVSEISWKNEAHPGTSANVAVLIDQGHGTRNGGYVPPRPYIKKAMDSVWNTAGDKIAKGLVE